MLSKDGLELRGSFLTQAHHQFDVGFLVSASYAFGV